MGATVACRILALMSQQSGAAESLLAEAATHAFAVVVGTCLADRTAPSEVFLPVSAAERIGARVNDAESTASVPSVFHQRVEHLALDLQRSILLALLRVMY